MNLSFSANEKDRIKRLADAYIQAKALVLYAEEIDPSARSNIQPIKELRDAYDHIMLLAISKAYPHEAGRKLTQEECLGNIEKAIGHVYRASFDALDGVVLSLKELIARELCRFPADILSQVLPDYWDIKIELQRLVDQVAKYREQKSLSEGRNELLDKYFKDVDRIRRVYDRILHSGPALEEALRESGKKAKREKASQLKIRILGGLVVALIIWVVTLLYHSYTSHPPQATPHVDSTEMPADK
jgi:hypothetical protein